MLKFNLNSNNAIKVRAREQQTCMLRDAPRAFLDVRSVGFFSRELRNVEVGRAAAEINFSVLSGLGIGIRNARTRGFN
jgi:hypothetical protein